MQVYLNDRLVPKADAVISVFDHGFMYGDGVYETMRAYDGVVYLPDQHLLRLYRSAALTGLTIPGDMDMMRTAINETLDANSLRNAYIRLTVSRGYGPIGLDPELCGKATLVIITEEMKEYPKSLYENGIKTIIAKTRRNLKDAIDPQIKSLNFLNNILAKIETKEKNAYEAIMLNVSGHIAEGTISNVFFYNDGILYTPSLKCGILDGITRATVMGLAAREGLLVQEGEFTPDYIYEAGEVFITNTTMEVMPVSQVDDAKYRIGDVARLLRKSYRDEVRAYVANIKGDGPSLWGHE